ncbi:hypothetical protein QFC21_006642 [Naganishia friedmannii]|uniref:Uncharacterized protein n=1 Tax=Naganishia friedmannii TaxID=89922 RepID=A0ACC2V1C9_9TREE|nr:hypothetical protein QFC21_006642 [Naganishia friedmannii]
MRIRSLVSTAALLASVHAIDARWGHRSTCLPDSHLLLIHGGKTDPSKQYTYSSAPNTGQTVVLDCSYSWTTEEVDKKWTVLGSDGRGGPEVAWHTMDLLGRRVLVFGGDGGVEMPIQTRNDSTWLIDLISSTSTASSTLSNSLNVSYTQ